jgi:hypothetical protein
MFKLVPSRGSPDTARCLQQLHADARAKKLIGIAYVAIYSQRHYEVNFCGEAERSPTFTRGAVGALDDSLSRLIHNGT